MIQTTKEEKSKQDFQNQRIWMDGIQYIGFFGMRFSQIFNHLFQLSSASMFRFSFVLSIIICLKGERSLLWHDLIIRWQCDATRLEMENNPFRWKQLKCFSNNETFFYHPLSCFTFEFSVLLIVMFIKLYLSAENNPFAVWVVYTWNIELFVLVMNANNIDLDTLPFDRSSMATVERFQRAHVEDKSSDEARPGKILLKIIHWTTLLCPLHDWMAITWPPL